jgi:putative transposase
VIATTDDKEAQAMRRVPSSVLVREELERLLAGGVDREANVVSALVETVTRLVVQELLEGEQADALGGRGRYERRREGRGGLRNGYEPGHIRTAEGDIEVRVPQIRAGAEPYRSTLMGFLEGNSDVLERLITEMYARGLSTRDVEDAFRDATGELLISKSAVSEITDRLWKDYEAFCARDLSEIEVEYLFLDAIFESLRRQGAKEALLVAWCIASDGRKHLLHLAVGNKESERCWTDFLRNMVDRGLRMPTTVTSDEAPGLINAIEAVFERSVRIRCWFHRLANIRAKLPDEAAPRSWPTSTRCATPRPGMLPAPPPTASRTPTGASSPPRWPASPRTATPCSPSTGCRCATASGCAPPTSPNAASRKSAGAPR